MVDVTSSSNKTTQVEQQLCPKGYSPIPVATLAPGTILPFAISTVIGRSPMLYRDAGQTFDEVRRLELETREIETLYIKESEQPLYHEYLQSNILRLLDFGDSNRPEAVERFYRTSQMVTRHFLDNPSSPESGEAAKQVVTTSVDQMERANDVLGYIHRVMDESPDLYAHSLHVALYGLALARSAGVDDLEVLSDFGVGLLLHDVGKTQLVDPVYSSSEELDNESWARMKEHPQLGVKLVADNPLVGDVARDVILNHHEKLDGTGYPGGKKADDLSLFAQIAAVVNTFDRRTTETPYRRAAASVEVLRGMIIDEKDQYNPKLLASFVRLMAG